MSKKKGLMKKEQGRDNLMSMDQAVEVLKTTRPTFYRWLKSGKIKGMKVGRQWRFARSEIDRFLKGEDSKMELRVDIGPLINELAAKCRVRGMDEKELPDEKNVESAVRLMILLGLAMRASDLHMEAQLNPGGEGRRGVLRCRVDGALHVAAEFDKRLLPPLVEQWKRTAGCDSQETVLPQDGRIQFEHGDEKVEGRICFIPAALGESLTLRLLRQTALVQLDRIHYADEDRARLDRAIHAPWGMVVVSGPTGSGKSTVLYACLSEIANPAIKCMSVEDPVEFLLPHVVQVPVKPQVGLTSPAVCRSVMRSDPDVVLVGEIRDFETLQLVEQMALTGHLVFTTLHADAADKALRRMVEIGSEPFMVSESVKLVLAQRLARVLCPECKKARKPSRQDAVHLRRLADVAGVEDAAVPEKLFEARGCDACGRLGYRGRNVLAETLEMDATLARALQENVPPEEFREAARKAGMTSIVAHGLAKIAAGETSLEEVARIIGI